jgi:peptidoglycan hydrolase FlgJ
MLTAQGISLPASLPHPLTGKSGATVHDAAAATKLKNTAKEFEATLLSMMLKEMRQTLDEDGGLFPGDSGDVQGGLFDMFMGRHLADSGGIGLATYLIQHMRATPSAKPITTSDAPAPTAQPAHSIVPTTARR